MVFTRYDRNAEKLVFGGFFQSGPFYWTIRATKNRLWLPVRPKKAKKPDRTGPLNTNPQPLCCTYAVADLAIDSEAHSYRGLGGGECGDETDHQINQHMQMMADQDISSEGWDIYVLDDSATAKLCHSFAAGGPATEQPRYGGDKGHNKGKDKICQR